jgi:hypothetical protein
VEAFLATEEITILKEDVVTLQDFIKTLEGIQNDTDESWTREKDTEDMKVFYKIEEGSALVTLYLEKVVKSPMINLLSLLVEADKFKDWMPAMAASEEMGHISNFRRFVRLEHKCPWPFQNRHCHLKACGMTVPENKSSYVAISSILGDKCLGQDFPKDDKHVYMLWKKASMAF